MGKAGRDIPKLLVSLAAAACTTPTAEPVDGRPIPEVPQEGPPADTRAHAEVTNRNWSDAVVYVVAGAERVRLGTVTSMRTHSFLLPPTVVGNGREFQLEADLVGSTESYTFPRLTANPGDLVDVTVHNYLPFSVFSVW